MFTNNEIFAHAILPSYYIRNIANNDRFCKECNNALDNYFTSGSCCKSDYKFCDNYCWKRYKRRWLYKILLEHPISNLILFIILSFVTLYCQINENKQIQLVLLIIGIIIGIVIYAYKIYNYDYDNNKLKNMICSTVEYSLIGYKLQNKI